MLRLYIKPSTFLNSYPRKISSPPKRNDETPSGHWIQTQKGQQYIPPGSNKGFDTKTPSSYLPLNGIPIITPILENLHERLYTSITETETLLRIKRWWKNKN